MAIAFLLIGVGLIAGGGYAVVDGWPYLLIERGFTQVIVGSVAITGGILLIGVSRLLTELRRVREMIGNAMLAASVASLAAEGQAEVPAPAAADGAARIVPPAALGGIAAAVGAAGVAGALIASSRDRDVPDEPHPADGDAEPALSEADVAATQVQGADEPWLVVGDGYDAPPDAQEDERDELAAEEAGLPKPADEPAADLDDLTAALDAEIGRLRGEIDAASEPTRWPELRADHKATEEPVFGDDFDRMLRERLDDEPAAAPWPFPSPETSLPVLAEGEPRIAADEESSSSSDDVANPDPQEADAVAEPDDEAAPASEVLEPEEARLLPDDEADDGNEITAAQDDIPTVTGAADDDPRHVEAAEPEAQAPAEPPAPPASEEGVVGAYQVGSAHFTIFADGTIRARTPEGEFGFGSMDELKEYLASEKSRLGV